MLQVVVSLCLLVELLGQMCLGCPHATIRCQSVSAEFHFKFTALSIVIHQNLRAVDTRYIMPFFIETLLL